MNNRLVKQLPKARHEKLVVKELPDETLVYNLETDKAHCLNLTAAMVWKSCDGETDLDRIAVRLNRNSDTKVDESIVWLALDQLEKLNLLDHAPARPVHLAGMTRRQMVRTLGLAGLALPAIISITSPTTAEAQSCLSGNNTPCIIGGTPCCTPRTCKPGPPAGTGPTECRP